MRVGTSGPIADVDLVAEPIVVDDDCAVVQLCRHLRSRVSISRIHLLSEKRDHRGLALAQFLQASQVDDVLRGGLSRHRTRAGRGHFAVQFLVNTIDLVQAVQILTRWGSQRVQGGGGLVTLRIGLAASSLRRNLLTISCSKCSGNSRSCFWNSLANSSMVTLPLSVK